ncbi:MAG: hypothetical protein KA191_17240 [Verrucomicrobia bacterium]|jgi:hypothetical protein|nr:hypothetical protein [Verrucomicrobiota bacterium]OQC68286.1 MAG: hypothetical protein BWX48_00110 [Verrucomicrobia bacterium ADurb.Bin006]NMD19558.1 hypothetical protein [Verrucomicrobiota bacterium]HOA63148.1 hypothetical protein [Verrucomicrobiota bacterium]HPW82650.1 hypothetical protein [Verrucomicrobiota bacterium]
MGDPFTDGGDQPQNQTLFRQVYGFRDDDFLRLKLYALHEAKHKLVG